jgi:hypothetical protein
MGAKICEDLPIFAIDFRTELDAAMSPDFAAATTWRNACNRRKIVELVIDSFRRAMEFK